MANSLSNGKASGAPKPPAAAPAPAPSKTSQGPAGPDRKPWYFAAAVGAFFGVASVFGLLQGLDNKWSDRMFWIRGVEAADPRIVVIAIDDAAIKVEGQYPWKRSVYKRMLDRLREAGVGLVAMDVLFLDRSDSTDGALGPNDRALIEATKQWGGRLVHATATDANVHNVNVFQEPFGELRPHAKSLGAVDQVAIDPDGSVRASNLVYGEEKVQDQLLRDFNVWAADPKRIPGLGVVAASILEGKHWDDYVKKHGNYVILNIRGETFETVQVGHDKKGNPVEITKFNRGVRRISAADVLAKKGMKDEVREALKGSVALVASTSLGAFDHYPSPFVASMPGVEVHATILDNLLNERFLKRVPKGFTLAACLAFALVAAGALHLGPMIGAVAALGVLVAWFIGGYYYFLSLRMIEPAGPALALLSSFGVLIVRKTLTEQAEKKFIKQTFGQFVSPDVVEKLVKDPSLVRLGGEKRDMTVFFLDIAHFTTISEKMDPEGLILFLNKYLSALSKIVQDHQGTVDKYIGDCIMAFWNAPLDDPKHRLNACLAAVRCQEVMAELNRELDPNLPETPAIRIGLNSGTMTVGLTGSEKKLAYTVIGDEVNLSSRLEGANKFFGSHIMVSEACFEGAKGEVEARVLGQVRVVGKSIPIKVFELVGLKGKLSPEWQKALPVYEKGVELFLTEKFVEAREAFAAVLKLLPEDKPAKLYFNACEDYSAIPPMGDWRVFNLTAK